MTLLEDLTLIDLLISIGAGVLVWVIVIRVGLGLLAQKVGARNETPDQDMPKLPTATYEAGLRLVASLCGFGLAVVCAIVLS